MVLKNIIIWFFGLAVALLAGLIAMAAIAKDKAPALAITLSPVNGFAAENLAAAFIKNSVAENEGQIPNHLTPNTERFALRAFVAEPITPEAVAVLALGRGERNRQKLMGLALALSRRQPLVTGWMIVDSGKRQNIPELLKHYDTILRTNSSAASSVMPILARALADIGFLAPFEELLRKQPPWANQFWGTVVNTPESLANATSLRKVLYEQSENKEAYRDAELIRALIANQEFEQAFDLYHHFVGDKKTRSPLEKGSFKTELAYSPLDWQLFSTGEYGAAINDGKLELSAIRNSGGLFARQLIKMPPRTLIMKVRPDAPITDNAQLFVTLECAESIKNPPRKIRIPLKAEIRNLQIGNTNSGCRFFWLDFHGRAAGNGDGFDVTIDSISLL
ncbi:hypothetical protein [Terasakiella pusilla]|uniref:hypothetical protein n=1 Tax=Terasakiella pusilla TaxID=64973 RepID=UPI003AA7E2CF